MNDIDLVKRLVEMLSAFFIEGIAVEEDLTYCLTSEFLRNIQDVLFSKQIVSYSRFQDYFNDKSEEMLSSPETYLRCVFYACLQDGLVNLNAFERFLNALAIILRISRETRLRKGLDFCKLVPDIFMEYYYEEVNTPFLCCNGFSRLVQYINDSKYLKLKCIVRNISSFYNPNDFMNGIPEDLSEKVQKMILKEQKLQTCLRPAKIDEDSTRLAKNVLKYTKPKFIPKLNDKDLNINENDSVRKKIPEISEDDLKESSERRPSSSSYSKTNDAAAVHIAQNTSYEDIIETVISHNNSKSSCHGKTKSRFQLEADRNLEHMKSTIDSLIQVLDEYDK